MGMIIDDVTVYENDAQKNAQTFDGVVCVSLRDVVIAMLLA